MKRNPPNDTRPTAIPTAFGEKKSGELWSTNNKVGHVSLNFEPTQINFFRKTIFQPLRELPKICFTRARDGPKLASAHPTGDGGPPTIFNNEHSQIGLKFGVCAPMTLGLGEATSLNFAT